MKKRFTALMAMVMAVGTICMAGPVMAAIVTAEGAQPSQSLTGGVAWESTWVLAESLDLFGATAHTDYNAGVVETTGVITVTDFDSNDAVYVSMVKGDWTLPGGYAALAGKKIASDTDLSVKVASVLAGPNGVTAVTGADSYQNLVTGGTAVNLVEGGTSGVTGILNAGFILDFKVIMDWLIDVPGTYTTTVTMTVVQGAI